MRLCGITSRFQLLSPCMRQVTHALLTRPPLSHKKLHTEVICLKCFVRLACVKHAASVHPEPGSNSHNKSLLLSFKLTSFLFVYLNLLFRLCIFRCSFIKILKEFSRLSFCSVVKVQFLLTVFNFLPTAYIEYHSK